MAYSTPRVLIQGGAKRSTITASKPGINVIGAPLAHLNFASYGPQVEVVGFGHVYIEHVSGTPSGWKNSADLPLSRTNLPKPPLILATYHQTNQTSQVPNQENSMQVMDGLGCFCYSTETFVRFYYNLFSAAGQVSRQRILWMAYLLKQGT